MTETPDCRDARALVQRAVTGLPVSEGDLERALAHLATCEHCAARVEVARTAACEEAEEDIPEAARLLRAREDLGGRYPDLARHLEECEWCRATLAELMREPDLLSEAGTRLDPSELFERSLATALADPETIVRQRAARRLAGMQRVGPVALAALADAAVEDPEEEVRATALRALDELDRAVSIPERVIDAWSASPEEAAPFIESVLARFAGDRPPASPAVMELAGSRWSPEQQMSFSSKEGITGRLSAEEGELRLALEGLPSSFEKTTPLIAVPGALRETRQPVEWFGKDPGLVPVDAPVARGRLHARLGRLPERPREAGGPGALERVYLLNREAFGKES